jgi:hypothetical protein
VRYPFIRSEDTYVVQDETRPHSKQVAHVYAFTLCYVAWCVGLLFLLLDRAPWVAQGWGNAVGVPAMIAIIALPWVVPWFLRRRAKNWRPGFK